ncbi:glycosyltransferase family 4 protein [Nanchangia anserum]|uniref:Glycosyltransferase family 4 protein n=1 Tax=Nanchangia anserum TaxID=2692125 RepID=A0A8I0KP90_9ACTO|nr:glycosyltransferase family 4 protein [Nanchangia anserum]MBD3690111.1 glycosyltransferase family 4 protein [Nanchangia anserum]QOX82103.1 glycosyltransferase family 4 protein [Nanchangia anserum]
MSRRGFVRIVSRIFPPEAGAAPLRLGGVADAVARSGARVEVITTTVPPGAAGEDEAHDVRRIPVVRDKDGYVKGYVSYLSFDIPAFVRQLVGPRPGIVLVEPPPTTAALTRIACAVRAVPYVAYAPDVWSEAARAFAPGIVVAALRAMESFGYRGARRVIAISDDVAATARGMGARRVDVVPNGIDTDVFTVDGPEIDAVRRDELGIGDAPYVVYAGTASQWQGAGIFVEALARVRDDVPHHLVFLGKGSEWDSIGEASYRLGIADRVHMLGTVPPAEAAAWTRGAAASAVSLRPGVGYDFAYPTKILSSLACGTPVLYAGPGPAVSDIRAADLGWACDYDADALAQVWRGVSQRDATQRQRVREWVETHRSLRASATRVAEILRDAASGE